MSTKFEAISLINLTTNESLYLSEENKTYILDGLPDWDYVTANINYVGYVNQLGSQKSSIYLEPRPITINGWVVANSIQDMKGKKRYLNSFINPFDDMRCEYEGYYIDFTPDRSIKYSKEYNKNNEVMCNFEIEGTCGVPLFSEIKKTEINQSPNYPVKIFPMEIDENEGTIMGLCGEGYSREIVNTGDVETWFKLVVTPTISPVYNPKVLLKNTGQFIKVSQTIRVGEKLVIITQLGHEQVYMVGLDGAQKDLMMTLTRDSDIFLLPRGDNTLEMSDDTGNLEPINFHIEFSPLYLEVQ